MFLLHNLTVPNYSVNYGAQEVYSIKAIFVKREDIKFIGTACTHKP